MGSPQTGRGGGEGRLSPNGVRRERRAAKGLHGNETHMIYAWKDWGGKESGVGRSLKEQPKGLSHTQKMQYQVSLGKDATYFGLGRGNSGEKGNKSSGRWNCWCVLVTALKRGGPRSRTCGSKNRLTIQGRGLDQMA